MDPEQGQQKTDWAQIKLNEQIQSFLFSGEINKKRFLELDTSDGCT